MCYLEQAHAGRCLRLAHRCVTDKVVLSSKTADYQLGAQHSTTTTMVKKDKADTFTILLCAALMAAALLLKTPISKRFFRGGHFSRAFHASWLSRILLRAGSSLTLREQAISGILGRVDDSRICGAHLEMSTDHNRQATKHDSKDSRR